MASLVIEELEGVRLQESSESKDRRTCLASEGDNDTEDSGRSQWRLSRVHEAG